MKHLGTVTLETDRLILRKCRLEDYVDSYKYCCSDPELARLQAIDVHENDQVTKKSFKEKEEQYLVDSTFYEWAIVRKEDGQFMGEIALVDYDKEYNAIQLGYHLGKAFRGNGYMQEALDRILKFAFEELDLEQVYALILNDNISSQKAVLSNNLVFSRTIENYKDEVYEGPIDKYKMTREMYFSLHNPSNNIVEIARNEIIRRSNLFQSETNGTKDEYNLWLEHIQFVYKYAMLIAKNKNVDLEVVTLSALLHDISMTDKNLERSKHNEYGAEIAEQFLLELGYPKDKIALVKKCILNHSSKRKEYRTTEEERILVDADGLSHFDSINNLYSLAHNVMELNDEDTIKFIQDKLTKDYNEISNDLKYLINDKYNKVMSARTVEELRDINTEK